MKCSTRGVTIQFDRSTFRRRCQTNRFFANNSLEQNGCACLRYKWHTAITLDRISLLFHFALLAPHSDLPPPLLCRIASHKNAHEYFIKSWVSGRGNDDKICSAGLSRTPS